MKAGTNEPKKVGLLVVLVVVAGVVWFFNRTPDSGPPPGRSAPSAPVRPPSAAAARNAQIAGAVEAPRANVSRSGRSGASASQEFRPSLKPRNPDERVDPASIDPTLKLELLANLQKVSLGASHRSLFDFSNPPPPPAPKTPEPKLDMDRIKKAVGLAANGTPAQPGDSPKPPPPPIPLKFYGFTNPAKAGIKRAFFLDGEEIVVATEGELIKKRYKVIRIGLSSAELEDTEQKNKQSLPLVAELMG